MLSPEPMRHLALVVMTADLEAATRAIARVGVLHLLDVHRVAESMPAIRPYDVSDRLNELDEIGRGLDMACRDIGVSVITETDDNASDEATDVDVLRSRVAQLTGEVGEVQSRLARAEEDRRSLETALRSVRALAPLDLPLQALRRLRYLHLQAGILPAGNLPRLQESLKQTPCVVSVVDSARADGRVLILVAFLRSDEDLVTRLLRSVQFEPADLPTEMSGSPVEVADNLEKQLRANEEDLGAIQRQRGALADRLGGELRSLRAKVQRERLLTEARTHMGQSERVSFIAGWVPAVLAGAVDRALREAIGGRFLVSWTDPGSIEGVRHGRIAVPILFRNPVLVRPFENLLRNYGLPRYGELEPTPIVAISFLTMFGFMFGDVGQGAVLFATGYFVYRRMFRYRDFALILMECGVFSTAFGFLYGSVFGIEHWLPALWLRPMEDMGRLMRTALFFGAGLLSLGLLLNVTNALMRRDRQALWGHNGLLGALAYWIAAGLLIRRLTVGPGSVTLGHVLAWLTVPVLLILLAGPVREIVRMHREGIRVHLGDLLSLFIASIVEVLDNLLSTIANTATFIRLAAFALAHAGLFLATFSVADAVAQGAGGTLGAAMIVILGNVLIIVLEGLIVSIQSIRLEYYEFFSRFYSGGGEEYRPLRFTPARLGR
jgi:V/A-type H+/Na+-transporting ATPase subunit I